MWDTSLDLCQHTFSPQEPFPSFSWCPSRPVSAVMCTGHVLSRDTTAISIHSVSSSAFWSRTSPCNPLLTASQMDCLLWWRTLHQYPLCWAIRHHFCQISETSLTKPWSPAHWVWCILPLCMSVHAYDCVGNNGVSEDTILSHLHTGYMTASASLLTACLQYPSGGCCHNRNCGRYSKQEAHSGAWLAGTRAPQVLQMSDQIRAHAMHLLSQ